MATWKVITKDKKSVEEHELWEKDGLTIIRITGFRYGSWIITTTTDKEPIFNRVRNPLGDELDNSIDMYSLLDENIESCDLDSLYDGWYSDVLYPDDIDQIEQERLDELWDEDSYEGWEKDGWIQTETECWVSCDLIVEKIED